MNDDEGDDAVNDSQVELIAKHSTQILRNFDSDLSMALQDPSNSSAKSVDAASRNTVQSSHPFRVIDNDGLSIHSMQSLGRVGRILSGSLDPGAMSVSGSDKQPAQKEQSESPTAIVSKSPSNTTIQSTNAQRKGDDSQSQNSNYSLTMNPNPNTILQEPDVIASTKLPHSKTTDSVKFLPKLCSQTYASYIVDHISPRCSTSTKAKQEWKSVGFVRECRRNKYRFSIFERIAVHFQWITEQDPSDATLSAQGKPIKQRQK